MNIRTQYNFQLQLRPASRLPSLTLPDQTMSLRTILDRYAKGLPISSIPTLDDADDEDADYHEFQKMDKIERIEYVRDYQEYVKKLRHKQAQEEREEKLRSAQSVSAESGTQNNQDTLPGQNNRRMDREQEGNRDIQQSTGAVRQQLRNGPDRSQEAAK